MIYSIDKKEMGADMFQLQSVGLMVLSIVGRMGTVVPETG